MVVVGGGLAGLVTARALATAGVDVTVCEAGSVLGGKLRLAEVAGHRVDVGAEAMLAVRPEGVDLLRDLGAADELVSPTATSASIWSRGALHPLPRATLMGVPTAQDGLSGLLTADELERWRAERPWPGGSVTAGLAIYDTMQFLKCDVVTYCVGQASSMAAVLLAAGAKGKRHALPGARIMIHQPWGGAQGAASDIHIQAQEILRLKDYLNGILAKHTGKPLKAIEKDTDRDFFMSAGEAAAYGLVDDVLGAAPAKA